MENRGSGLQPRNRPAIRRRYDGSRRAAAAAATRHRIVEAAAACFDELGYRRTTLVAVAERAGVSVESVSAAGPKRELMIAAFSLSFAGEETEGSLSTREPWASALRAPRERLADALAEVIVTGQARGIGLWRTLVAAVRDEPELEPHYAALAGRRRADNLVAVEVLHERGVLRQGVPVEEHADTVALLTGFDPYQLYVRDFGWTETALRAWTSRMFETLVLGEAVAGTVRISGGGARGGYSEGHERPAG
ncbi:TetR family transcriptional regulator [Herbiconiux sp. KACC 21604]|uniref:TetR/AcrR family transcriptional regulator n=1 Tax=unclassified Herbiconiux TaxID=2618217 RepID=UPI0014931D15|nr:TetR/AcrR family transcriptional regulator [Herbiconiux sp. SALV-R1]QJU54292.1 TetR family transcriptional regulator [Herbiconiux sp. SALV-R1]WPO85360.1 TetR family transcriptional regulator [Herbiconiux sp. KACC 21604]